MQEKLRAHKEAVQNQFVLRNISRELFNRFKESVANFNNFHVSSATKHDETWKTAVLLPESVRVDDIPFNEESIQISYVPMIQHELGRDFWWFPATPKLRPTTRSFAGTTVFALPVTECGLVFRWDRNNFIMRVQFQVRKGPYDPLITGLEKTIHDVQFQKERLLGKWIKDEEEFFKVVAVEMNTLNIANLSKDKKRASKHQEIFQAKPIAWAISRKALMTCSAHILESPNNEGFLMDAKIFRAFNHGQELADMFSPNEIVDEDIFQDAPVITESTVTGTAEVSLINGI